ncbi:MAG: hypothetical protein CMH41_03505 [Micrococcales bacterium]|nr:hypothetical protein [Micrococcales bacterium]
MSFGVKISTAVAVVCALATTACSPVDSPGLSTPVDELEGTASTSGPEAPERMTNEVLTRPEGLFARLTSNGLTVSWFGVSGATDGYQVAIDGAWRAVSETKVQYPSIKPGLTYRIQVAAAANGERGPAATTTVGTGRSAKPREVIKAKPSPIATAPATSNSSTPTESATPDVASDRPSSTPDNSSRPQITEETTAPSSQQREIVKVRSNGCGFTGDGTVNLQVTVLLAPGTGPTPSALSDTSGRLYVPTKASVSDKIIFKPVPTGEPPDGAAIDAALITANETTESSEISLEPTEWGYQLCDQEIADPRWP